MATTKHQTTASTGWKQLLFFTLLSFGNVAVLAQAEDYYVCAARGKGKVASKQKPAKELGNLVSKLEAGDTVHIAEGFYTGRGDCGTTVINVPINIIGGYDSQFSRRAPWGAHQTILTGLNTSSNWQGGPTLFVDLAKYTGSEMPSIKIDGLIIDNAGRNHYSDESELRLVRKASPKSGHNPSPDEGGLVVVLGRGGNRDATWSVRIENNIVMNCAASQGALSVLGFKGSDIVIQNNLVINNTGSGIHVGTKFIASVEEDKPAFLVENNTVLFTWKYDPFVQSWSGDSIRFDTDVAPTVRHNIFAAADMIGINNVSRATVQLENNAVFANAVTDYLEFDTQIDLDDMEDEADRLHPDSGGNSSAPVPLAVNGTWAANYANRVLINRNAAEADIEAQKTRANEMRSMLGLPLRASEMQGADSPVWLNRLQIADAITVAAANDRDRGCKIPSH